MTASLLHQFLVFFTLVELFLKLFLNIQKEKTLLLNMPHCFPISRLIICLENVKQNKTNWCMNLSVVP